ncbi:uroporphyrinogen-III synthase [Maribacter litopenaei]|uniref:Uroporphyrinogen-III synthase n=1 Tax=Maribacter litopenaei TaxID=2976127 RepID=A0ABY5Y9U3_9FLAO|nr:uroporphyrinogen-III synthase [Maribacter litopenaei]UWX55097.1 uroporphyrinogen-III synthase [Maribacter litopenaei]
MPETVEGILFYSPSTIESYLLKNKPNQVAYCIGETTAKEARKHFKEVKVANIPDMESVIDLVNESYK